jgi:hypothetical protein
LNNIQKAIRAHSHYKGNINSVDKEGYELEIQDYQHIVVMWGGQRDKDERVGKHYKYEKTDKILNFLKRIKSIILCFGKDKHGHPIINFNEGLHKINMISFYSSKT